MGQTQNILILLLLVVLCSIVNYQKTFEPSEKEKMSIVTQLMVIEDDRRFSFTVDNSVISVGLSEAVGKNNTLSAVYDGGVEGTYFEVGETINILEVGIMCPHAFVLAEPIVVQLQGISSVNDQIIYESITIPYLNVAVEVNKNISLEEAQTDPGDPTILEKSQIRVNFTNTTLATPPAVSMLNVPALINGETVKLVPFVKLEHNFILTGVP